VVHLNIGGHYYSTSKAVITSRPDSLLAVMFSKNWEGSLLRDGDGRVFIDRDGKPFRLVLRFLRGERLVEPEKDDPEFTYLLECAKYFQINDLVSHLENNGRLNCCFVWDGRISPGASVSEDGLSVSGKNSVTSSTCFETGNHRWHISIDNYCNGWVGVGITTSVEEENWGGYSYNVWGYSANGYIWSAGKRDIGETYGTGDIITVEVDCHRRLTTFKKNGRTVTTLNFSKVPIYPIVRCNNINEKVTLVFKDVEKPENLTEET